MEIRGHFKTNAGDQHAAADLGEESATGVEGAHRGVSVFGSLEGATEPYADASGGQGICRKISLL